VSNVWTTAKGELGSLFIGATHTRQGVETGTTALLTLEINVNGACGGLGGVAVPHVDPQEAGLVGAGLRELPVELDLALERLKLPSRPALRHTALQGHRLLHQAQNASGEFGALGALAAGVVDRVD